MVESTALVPTVSPDLATVPFTYKTLTEISTTEFVPEKLRNRPAAILACIMYGREWGLGPMESLQMIDMIEGRPSPAAQLLVAKVYAAGHEIFPGEITATSATAVAIRHSPRGDVRHEFTFTMEDAQRAGLATKVNFRTYPGTMCYWRAASQLIRFVFPDLLGPSHAYSPDELGSETWTPPDEVIDAPAGRMVQPIVIEEKADPAEVHTVGADVELVEPTTPADAFEAVQEAFPGAEAVTPETDEEALWFVLMAQMETLPTAIAQLPATQLEPEVRTLCSRMVATKMWPETMRNQDGETRDAFHAALWSFGLKDPAIDRGIAHWSDLGLKAVKQRFASFVYEAAKRRLEKEAQGE